METYLKGVLLLFAVSAAIAALGRLMPGFLAPRIHALIQDIKKSAWLRDPKKPKRARFFLAFLEMVEDEIPEPGAGAELYAALGKWIEGIPFMLADYCPIWLAGALSALGILLKGTAPKWAKALEATGDKLDETLDQDIADMRTICQEPT